MKPAPFLYAAPDTLEEALELLARYGAEAKALAGGQSLMPLLNLRLARPQVLIDLNRLASLERCNETPGHLVIGALTRLRTLERAAEVGRLTPLLAEALPHVGHPAIRSRGTAGGSLVHADPAAELPAVVLALDGEILTRAVGRERLIPAREFFVDLFTTALEPSELVVEIRLPLPSSSGPAGSAFLEIARRHGDFAIAAAACVLDFTPDGMVDRARMTLAGVDTRPVRAVEAEKLLGGQTPSTRAFSEAGQVAANPLNPPSDIHAPAVYRRRVTAVLVERALALATRRAGIQVG